MYSSEHLTAIVTNDNLRKAVIAAVASFLSISAGLNHSPAYQFSLHSHVNISWDNRFMATFNVILRNDTSVLNSGLVKKISDVSLLKKGITDVFLIAENLVDGAGMSSRFTSTGKNAIRFKTCSNLIHAIAFKIFMVDSFYNFSLFQSNHIIKTNKTTIIFILYR